MPETTTTSRELRDRALNHHRSGNFAAAIADYETLLKDHPDDADVLGLLATALHQSGQPAAARSKWLLSLTLPADPYIKMRNLNNLLAAGIATGLATDPGAWTEITVPDWPAERRPAEAEKDLVISLGRALLKIGKQAQAVRLIDSAASFAAGDLIIARNLAEILIEAGQPDKAHRLLADIAGISSGKDGERLLALAATAHAAGAEGRKRSPDQGGDCGLAGPHHGGRAASEIPHWHHQSGTTYHHPDHVAAALPLFRQFTGEPCLAVQ